MLQFIVWCPPCVDLYRNVSMSVLVLHVCVHHLSSSCPLLACRHASLIPIPVRTSTTCARTYYQFLRCTYGNTCTYGNARYDATFIIHEFSSCRSFVRCFVRSFVRGRPGELGGIFISSAALAVNPGRSSPRSCYLHNHRNDNIEEAPLALPARRTLFSLGLCE